MKSHTHHILPLAAMACMVAACAQARAMVTAPPAYAGSYDVAGNGTGFSHFSPPNP
jgi:hypothetical protein